MQILTGAKKVRIRNGKVTGGSTCSTNIHRIEVPHYQTLALDRILGEFGPPHAIYQYLPDEINEFVANRQFVLDVDIFLR